MKRCDTTLMGRIFGHKFTHQAGDWIYKVDHCRRCGLHIPGYWLGGVS